MKQINQLPQLNSANNNDVIPIQTAEGLTYKITKANFLEGLSSNTNSSAALPTSFTHFHDESIIVSGNSLVYDSGNPYTFFTVSYQFPSANGNAFKFYKVLDAGSYRLRMLLHRGGNRAILKLTLNGTDVLTNIDMYSGGFVMDTINRDFTIATPGNQEFLFTVTGKNNSSSDFYALIVKFWGYKL